MILFVGAMHEELKDIIANDQALVIETGIGKVNAAMQLTKAISNNQVKAIYNVGFAGASKHFNVGDMILIEEAMYHDFDLTFFGYEKGQVPHCPQKFKSDQSLMKNIKTIYPKIKSAMIYTGDYFMTESVDKPYVVDMEATALYQVANHYQIPIVSIKIISDIIGMDEHYKSYKKFETTEGSKLISQIYQKLFKE